MIRRVRAKICYKSGLDRVLHLWRRLLHNMPPCIDIRNTYYLQNVHNQRHLHVSRSSVACGVKVENPSHQVVRIESPHPFSCCGDNFWRWICSGNSSQPDLRLLIISFRMLEIVNTWVFKGAATLSLMDFTMSSFQQSAVPGRFLGIPLLLRSSKWFLLFLPPPPLLIQAINI